MNKNILIALLTICVLILLSGVSGKLHSGITQAQYSKQNVEEIDKNLPPPKPGRGHALGVALLKGTPKKGLPIYLYRNTNGVAEPLGFIPKTDKQGRWVALNMKPGRYFTAYTKNFSPKIVIWEHSIKEVKAGCVTDFGTKDFQSID